MSVQTTESAFDPGLRGESCWLEILGGDRVELPTARWSARLDEFDRLMLAGCAGPTLDVGCGPGRLTAALVRRGLPALGVDTSALAVRLTHARGAPALHRNVFSRVPGEGQWRHLLLADGNIGIGGNPLRLLRRVRALLHRSGSALVELDRPDSLLRTARVRLRSGAQPGGTRHSGAIRSGWFDWAWLGVDAIEQIAPSAALDVVTVTESQGRSFAELVPSGAQ